MYQKFEILYLGINLTTDVKDPYIKKTKKIAQSN